MLLHSRAWNSTVLSIVLLMVLISGSFCSRDEYEVPTAQNSTPKGQQVSTPWGISYKPNAGFIPDEKTAVAVAEALLRPIYGDNQVVWERPFHASLEGDVWTVSGTLPKGLIGGVAVVRLSKSTAAVLYVTHGQ